MAHPNQKKYLVAQSFYIWFAEQTSQIEIRFVFDNIAKKVMYVQRNVKNQWETPSLEFFKYADETLRKEHLLFLLSPPYTADHAYQSDTLPAWADGNAMPVETLEKVLPQQPEQDATRTWYMLCSEQGWDDASKIIHLEGFLRDKGLFAEFVDYASQAADEENGEIVD